jgi:hypothetical protein
MREGLLQHYVDGGLVIPDSVYLRLLDILEHGN